MDVAQSAQPATLIVALAVLESSGSWPCELGPSSNKSRGHRMGESATVSALQHHVYDGDKWVRQSVCPHPMVTGVILEVHIPSYSDFGFQEPEHVRLKRVAAICDNGAQMFELQPSEHEEPPDPFPVGWTQPGGGKGCSGAYVKTSGCPV